MQRANRYRAGRTARAMRPDSSLTRRRMRSAARARSKASSRSAAAHEGRAHDSTAAQSPCPLGGGLLVFYRGQEMRRGLRESQVLADLSET